MCPVQILITRLTMLIVLSQGISLIRRKASLHLEMFATPAMTMMKVEYACQQKTLSWQGQQAFQKLKSKRIVGRLGMIEVRKSLSFLRIIFKNVFFFGEK